MLFHKVILNNYKVYYGEHTVDCSLEDNSKPIILIGGATGAGKTSFLEAIKLCLYGRFNKQLLKGYQSYNKYLTDIHNKKARQGKKSFSVSIEYKTNEIRDIDIYKIERRWSLLKDQYKEELLLSINGESREAIDKSEFQNEIDKYFPLGIGEMLFFDSEVYNTIPDFLENGFISSLNKYMGIEKYMQLSSDLVTVKKHHVQSNDPELAKRIKEKEQKISDIDKQIEQNRKSVDSIFNEIEDLEKTCSLLKNKLKRQSGKLALKQEEIFENKGKLREKNLSLLDKQRTIFSDLNPISTTKELCIELIKQLESEEQIKNRRIINKELKKFGKKLIDDLKTDFSKTQINKLTKSVDEEIKSHTTRGKIIHDISVGETKSIINEIKDIINTTENTVNTVKSKLKRIRLEQRNIQIKERMINPEGPGGKIYNELLLAMSSIDKKRQKLTSISEDNINLSKSKETLNSESEFLHKKVQLESKEEYKSNLIDKTLGLLDDFSDFLTKSRFKALKKTFLKTIEELSTKGQLVSNITIDQQNKKLRFLNKKDEMLNVKDFSAGESELVSFSLLWAVNISSNKFYPIVSDSPFNRLDSKHRKLFIDNILKKSKSQIIFLSTDEEITNTDHYGIEKYISKTYLIEHNKKNRSSKIVGKSYFS